MGHAMTRRSVLAAGTLAAAGAALGAAAGVASASEASGQAAGSAAGAALPSGTYAGSAQGRSGEVDVEVYVDKGCVLDVKVTKSSETATLRDYAFDKVSSDIVRYQSLDVDTVSGATLASFAVINGVENALEEAGVDTSALHTAPAYPEPDSQDAECDVVVVGAGAAGMMAAIQAKKAGARVIVVEKQGMLGGGDAMFASSGMGGGGGYVVYKNGVEGHSEQDYLDNKTASAEKSGLPVDMGNLSAYCLMSGEALDYYVSIGVPFGKYNEKTFSNQIDDGTSPGTHIIRRLGEELGRQGIEYRLNTRLVSIEREDGGAVTGVVVDGGAGEYRVSAKAVVLASGGFGYNDEMLAEYADAARYAGLPHSGACSATGEGILAAQAAGAALSNMDAIKANNICHVADNGAVVSLASVQSVAALVDDSGKRFISESASTINEKSEAELALPGQEAWAVFDQKMMDAKAQLRGYDKLGYFVSGQTWEELAEAMGLDEEGAASLASELGAWQELGEGADDPEFGGKVTNAFDQPPFYAAHVQPAMQSTYGGVTTDAEGRALDESGQPIPGLYAAGAVSGHGCFGNQVGNGLTIASTFGMIAGRAAAAEALAE